MLSWKYIMIFWVLLQPVMTVFQQISYLYLIYLIYKSFTFKRYWPACFVWRAELYDPVSSTVSTTIPQRPFCQIAASSRTHHLHHRWCHQVCHFRWDQTPLVHQSTSPGDCRSYEGWWDQEIPACTQYYSSSFMTTTYSTFTWALKIS